MIIVLPFLLCHRIKYHLHYYYTRFGGTIFDVKLIHLIIIIISIEYESHEWNVWNEEAVNDKQRR